MPQHVRVDFFIFLTSLLLCSANLQYPIAENGFEFQESLVKTLYSLNIWDRLRALVNVLKMLTDQNDPSGGRRKKD